MESSEPSSLSCPLSHQPELPPLKLVLLTKDLDVQEQKCKAEGESVSGKRVSGLDKNWCQFLRNLCKNMKKWVIKAD